MTELVYIEHDLSYFDRWIQAGIDVLGWYLAQWAKLEELYPE